MMAQTHSVTEFARHFAEYINRVSYRGECFVLMRGNKPVAELRPLPAGKTTCRAPSTIGVTSPSLPNRSNPVCRRPHGGSAGARSCGGPRSVAVLIDASIL